MEFEFCKMEIFVPVTHLEEIRQALQRADAGHIGNYDSCLSYGEVTGCWRPLEGSRPYSGEVGRLCTGREYKVEVICKQEKVDETIRAVKAAHPYEVPVINVIPLYRTGLSQE
ncbi:cytochrome C biogenesis protein [Clostridium sp. W14A]|uniref:Divalent cation tolerance protein CutA n=1 Tax=Caproicibacter fermentans TaxID=2576756 RepID=A0A7G8TEL7_9FIRM|nr:divalent cation tolerance protein CutA [Caproicibacter fermentans]OCN00225.1 cytochrome C biogenesis protein [Clostridium sp. W14A]QNK42058.1 divalent cation tolerance protein CutA [Caproicibacter fermentans]